MVSETFNYSRIDRQKAKMKRNIEKHFPTVGRHFHRIGMRPKVCPVCLSLFSVHDKFDIFGVFTYTWYLCLSGWLISIVR